MNFAPYAPPPDEHRQGTSKYPRKPRSESASSSSQPWVNKPPNDAHEPNAWNSYQKGGSAIDPTHSTSYSSHQAHLTGPSPGSSRVQPGFEPGSPRRTDPDAFQSPGGRGEASGRIYPSPEAYETRFGWRVDLLSALAYCTPPMAIIILMIEIRNDFVRIHAYQSLLLALPLGFLHLLFLSSHFLQVFLLLIDVCLYGWLGYQAYFDAGMLIRKLLPVIGPLAERWTEEE
ncbi:hypothetical protein CROQUDRAFT_656977 [Cronartium quercuum f. sp. fusiforme G11]|uniref:Uncharacterized protein n=1 Tax=Cronartium quercuum f. sp. fusiforme G11 TaxID=708437 RepID=A0A9P6NMJ7_9BASI|nr:hypothetical protein CROQUDRAFT_656977 [Cronartium quercuum f. sp. fusiforme G11]